LGRDAGAEAAETSSPEGVSRAAVRIAPSDEEEDEDDDDDDWAETVWERSVCSVESTSIPINDFCIKCY
jgi:hypothetical protein